MMIRDHLHPGFEPPSEGRDVDVALLGALIGATYDGCRDCQRDLIGEAADHPPTAARLVELACVAIHTALGGLPTTLLADREHSPVTPQFRSLARAGVNQADTTPMWHATAAMTVADRAAAIDSALDLIVGQVGTAVPRTYA